MKFTILTTLLTFTIFSLYSQVAPGTKVSIMLDYVISNKKPILKVTINFPVSTDSGFKIPNIKSTYSGKSNKYVSNLMGLDGSIVNYISGGDSLIIQPKQQKVKFIYTLVYDSASIGTNTYSPSIGLNHYHLFFDQLIMPITDRNTPLVYDIDIHTLPNGWNTYNSFNGEKRKISWKSSFGSSFSKVIAAGIFFKKQFSFNGKPLNIYIVGKYGIDNILIAKRIKEIILFERKFFEDFDFDFFSVALLPREGNVAGIAIDNMFVTFVKSDVRLPKLSWLLSHEIAHQWIGRRMILNDTTSFKIRHQWFSEGITDYFSFYTLLKTRVFSESDFVEYINMYLRNIKENLYSFASEDSITKVIEQGKYGIEAVKLPYYKGMLIGLLADHNYLVNYNKNHSRVAAFLKFLWDTNKNEDNKKIDESLFFSIADSFNIPLKNLFYKYVIKGEGVFNLPKTLFNNTYYLKHTSYQAYALGFTSFKKDGKTFIQTIDDNSPAYKAGLKTGMEIVSDNITPRFGNAWEFRLIRLKVKWDNKIYDISFLPIGKKVIVQQYFKKKNKL